MVSSHPLCATAAALKALGLAPVMDAMLEDEEKGRASLGRQGVSSVSGCCMKERLQFTLLDPSSVFVSG